jgi:hypothetical protein
MPMTNRANPQAPSWQQQQNLGRYRPPTMSGTGGGRFNTNTWNDDGGYDYNLPGSFGSPQGNAQFAPMPGQFAQFFPSSFVGGGFMGDPNYYANGPQPGGGQSGWGGAGQRPRGEANNNLPPLPRPRVPGMAESQQGMSWQERIERRQAENAEIERQRAAGDSGNRIPPWLLSPPNQPNPNLRDNREQPQPQAPKAPSWTTGFLNSLQTAQQRYGDQGGGGDGMAVAPSPEGGVQGAPPMNSWDDPSTMNYNMMMIRRMLGGRG